MDPKTWGPAEISAACAVGALGVAVVVAIFAAVQILQARRLREEQSRPYVIVDFDFRRFLVQIAITNIGSTPAREVSVTFDKPLQPSSAARRDINTSSVFAQPIPMLAPGRTIRVAFDSGPELFKRDDLPLRYETTVKYQNMKGKRFEDPPFPLDLTPYKHTPISPKGIPELVKEVEGVRSELRKWTNGGGGLRVLASDNDRRQVREMRSYYISQAHAVWRDDGPVAWFKWLCNEVLLHYGWR